MKLPTIFHSHKLNNAYLLRRSFLGKMSVYIFSLQWELFWRIFIIILVGSRKTFVIKKCGKFWRVTFEVLKIWSFPVLLNVYWFCTMLVVVVDSLIVVVVLFILVKKKLLNFKWIKMSNVKRERIVWSRLIYCLWRLEKSDFRSVCLNVWVTVI